MPDPLREELAARGFAVVRATPDLAPETAARVPWIFAEKLLGERPRMVERQPIKAVPGGRSFASSAGPAPLHTDSQMYAGTPPSVQIMACVRPAERGGDTVLVDTWALLDRVAAADPFLYDLLFDVPRRIPFVFGDVFGPTVTLRGGALVFTHPPAVSVADPVSKRLAPFVDAAPRIERSVGAGEILVVDNHRMLHGRHAFEGNDREYVRLLVWSSPCGNPPPAHRARAEEAARSLAARLTGASAPVLRRVGLGAAPPAVAERRLSVVMEMLRGVPPGVLSAREKIPEPELYRMRDAALAAAEAALGAGSLPASDDEVVAALLRR